MRETVADCHLVGRAGDVDKDALQPSGGKPAFDPFSNLGRIEAIGLYHEVRLEVAWQPARQQRSDGRRLARLKQWSIGRSIQAASQFGGLRRQRDDAVALADARPVVLAHRRAAADRDDDAVALQRALQAARLALAEPGLAFSGENLGY